MNLPGYEVLGELGRGGQGVVYKARDVATGALRAVKVLEHERDPESLARFRREAETLARLGGRGFVGVHHAGVVDGHLYFVMDLMPGGSLAERLRDGERLDARAVATLGSKLAGALAGAHALGLIHRDLKPGNVLFDDVLEPRIADLGLVRELSSASLTGSGMSMGTMEYMAPEQLEGHEAGPPVDVFALGLILHELLAGERPFPGTAPHLILRAMQASGRKSIAGCPRALDELIARALSFEPERRPEAHALAAELERTLTDGAARPPRGGPLVRLVLALGVISIAGFVARCGGAPAEPAPVVTPTPIARPPLRSPSIAPSARASPRTPVDTERLAREKAEHDAQIELEVARGRLQRGDLEDALEHATRARELVPGKAQVHALLAEIHLRREELDLALDWARRALELDPRALPPEFLPEGATPPMFERAIDRLQVGALGESVRRLVRLRFGTWMIALDPGDPRGWNERAQARYDVEDLAGARADSLEAVRLGDPLGGSYVRLASLAEREHDLRAARKYALTAATKISAVAASNDVLSRVFEGLDEVEEAFDAAGKAIDIHSNSVGELFIWRAFLEARVGKVELAVRDVARGVVSRPTRGWWPPLANAEIELARGHPDRALALLAPAISDPNADRGTVAAARVRYLRARHGTGDLEAAASVCTEALKEDGGARIQRARALVLEELGRDQDADHDLTAALALDPELRGARRERGELRARLSRTQEALADLDLAVAAEPEDWRTWAARARVRASARDAAGAAPDLVRALALGPPEAERAVLTEMLARLVSGAAPAK